MPKTVDESLAFVQHITTGKGLVHFEAVLGVGGVPSVEDFTDDAAYDKCDAFLIDIEDYVSCLAGILGQTKVRAERKKAAERKSYLPGMAPEEPAVGTQSPPAEPEDEELNGTVPPASTAPKKRGRPKGSRNARPVAEETHKPSGRVLGEARAIPEGGQKEAAPPPRRVDTSPVLERPLSKLPYGDKPATMEVGPDPEERPDTTDEWELPESPEPRRAPEPPVALGGRVRRQG